MPVSRLSNERWSSWFPSTFCSSQRRLSGRRFWRAAASETGGAFAAFSRFWCVAVRLLCSAITSSLPRQAVVDGLRNMPRELYAAGVFVRSHWRQRNAHGFSRRHRGWHAMIFQPLLQRLLDQRPKLFAMQRGDAGCVHDQLLDLYRKLLHRCTAAK